MSFQDEIAAQAMRGLNDSPNDTLEAVLKRRFSRREVLKRGLLAAPTLVLGGKLIEGGAKAAVPPAAPGGSECALGFTPISLTKADDVVLPSGYEYQVLLRWGDPVLPAAMEHDFASQTRARQEGQFGYNCDFNGYFPLPHFGVPNSNHGVLAVNHEYTDPQLMFPGYVTGDPTRDQVDVEIAAHGMSFVEIQRRGASGWTPVRGSRFNRRITGETPMQISGPAAGHAWLQTSEDPGGSRVRGTLNNCAGGKTPWGTVLTCEENFNQYFANRNGLDDADPRKAAHARYGLPGGASSRRWENHHARFNIALEPNEPFRHGWVVEIDPCNPADVPRKRTALGRFKHEGATCVIAPTGQVVVYSGDDERFDYIYKFVTAGRFNPRNRAANLNLLDHGTLYAARFHDDGTGEWLPLVFGKGPLTPDNGFHNQGDVVINARRAADVLGATKMDRPEDIEANPVTGKVYSLLTNNTNRGEGGTPGTDAANPRSPNRYGHVIEQTEAAGDHSATVFNWEIFILCGDPGEPGHDTYFAGFDQNLVSPISAPDNLVFDCAGNCWIATDGLQNGLAGNDGVFAVPTEGPERGYLRQFMSCPLEAEICGPEFTPDFSTLFVGIQHPGEGSASTLPGDLLSTWPDGGIPKPSVIAITKTSPGARTIGS
jgi:hypothetical protein